jgi:hypothetical protein
MNYIAIENNLQEFWGKMMKNSSDTTFSGYWAADDLEIHQDRAWSRLLF